MTGRIVALALFGLLLAGCAGGSGAAPAATAETERIAGSLIKDPNSELAPDQQLHLAYRPLNVPYQLELKYVGESEVPSGSEVKLRFRLKNTDRAPVQIDEWYMADPNNIIVYFRPWHPNETPEQAAVAEWYSIAPTFSPELPPPARAPLMLDPENMTFIDVAFPVIKEIPADKSTWFIVYGQLNLVSVDVIGNMFTIKSVRTDTPGE